VLRLDEWAAKAGLLAAGAVTKAVEEYGLANGWGETLHLWPAESWRLGALEAKRVVREAKPAASPTTANDAKAEVIGPDKVTRLNAELNRTGNRWSEVAAFLVEKHGAPKNITPKDLTREQWRAAMAALAETPDADAAAAPRK
jgi:hypothetical protein